MNPSVSMVLGELVIGGQVVIVSEVEDIQLTVDAVEDGPAAGGKTVRGKIADKLAVLYLYPGKHDPMDPFDSIGHIELDPEREEQEELEEFERFARSFD